MTITAMIERRAVLRHLFAVLAVFFFAMGAARGAPGGSHIAPGTSYKIMRPLYLMAVYDSMAAKTEGRGPARAYLHSARYYKTRWVAYQCKIPAGTTMTVIGPASPAKDLWRRFDAYYVKLRPAPSQELDVIVELFQGLGDASGALSAEFFAPVSGPDDTAPAQSACVTEPGGVHGRK